MEAVEARPSLHLSKCHTVGNLMSRLILKLDHSDVSTAYLFRLDSPFCIRLETIILTPVIRSILSQIYILLTCSIPIVYVVSSAYCCTKIVYAVYLLYTI